MNLLPAVEAYCTQRISDLAKFHVEPAQAIRELESVRSLCRGLVLQDQTLKRLMESPCGKPIPGQDAISSAPEADLSPQSEERLPT